MFYNSDRELYEEEYEGFKIKQLDGQKSSFYEVKPVSKGSLPNVLVGMYTSINQAKQAVDVWLRAKRPRVSAGADAKN